MGARLEIKVRLFKLWLPVFICMGTIFFISTIPQKDMPGLFLYQDIVGHFVIYAVLGFFFLRALKKTAPGISALKLVAASLIFCFLYGISDEVHQLFTPGRECSLFDICIDTAGGLIGSLSYR